MIKYLRNKIECFFLDHDLSEMLMLRQNLIVEDVVVGEKTIKCVATIESEVTTYITCDRCGHKSKLSGGVTIDKVPLELDIAYLAGLYSESMIENAESFFENTLFYPMAEILKEDFRPAVLSGHALVEAVIAKNKTLRIGVKGIEPWGPVGDKNILAFRDELVETETNLKIITDTMIRYNATIKE